MKFVQSRLTKEEEEFTFHKSWGNGCVLPIDNVTYYSGNAYLYDPETDLEYCDQVPFECPADGVFWCPWSCPYVLHRELNGFELNVVTGMVL